MLNTGSKSHFSSFRERKGHFLTGSRINLPPYQIHHYPWMDSQQTSHIVVRSLRVYRSFPRRCVCMTEFYGVFADSSFSVLTVNYCVQDSKSNWLEGMILMCMSPVPILLVGYIHRRVQVYT
jgi:hypothetical protein